MRSLLPAALCLFVASTAYAEEEVRIALFSDKSAVELAGKSLAIYDSEVGDRLVTVPSARLEAKQGMIEVLEGGKVVARGRRLLVEAKGGISLDRGVFLGRIELSVEGTKLLAINRLPLETYLLGIVGSEMSPDWPIEALKAQAVAARTYAMQRHMMMRAADKPYDLESTVISQVYKGAERIKPSVIEAVRATRGEVIAYQHGLAEALFHSTCGGKTSSAKSAFGRSVPYLTSRPCQWCRDSTRSRWKLSIPVTEMSRLLEAAHIVRGKIDRFDRKESDGKVKVQAKKTSLDLSPRAVREAVGFTTLYSERFTAETKGKKVEIEGRGFGHGVGMCQWGARGMALEGRLYHEILEHYYFGAHVQRIY